MIDDCLPAILRDHLRPGEVEFEHRMFGLPYPEAPERVTVVASTWNLFPALQRDALLGRVFTAEEDQPGKDAVAVLSHDAGWGAQIARAAQLPIGISS